MKYVIAFLLVTIAAVAVLVTTGEEAGEVVVRDAPTETETATEIPAETQIAAAAAFPPPEPDPPPPPKPGASVTFFAMPRVVELEITVDEPDLSTLRRDPREYVRATIREGDTVYREVGIHLKGAAGSFRHFDDKPALTLNFDKFVAKQKFHGMDKLHLNNSVQDRGYLSELVCGDLFRAADVPASRVAHAHVVLNGRDRGLYVLKEGFDKEFLERWFEDKHGNLYDGGFLQEIGAHLERTSGSGPDDGADLSELADAARESDLKVREKRLDELLDIERFLSFVALEMFTWHWDGYVMKRNNYRLYHDPTSGRIVFMPHGLDQMFRDTDGPIVPRHRSGLVSRAVLSIPRWRKRYLERFRELLDTVIRGDEIDARIDAVCAELRASLSESLARSVEQRASDLRWRISRRIDTVTEQLARYEAGDVEWPLADTSRRPNRRWR